MKVDARRAESPRLRALRTYALGAYAVGGAAGAWFLHLNVSYLLVPWSCRVGNLALHLATVVGVVLAAGSGVVAWRIRNAHPSGTPGALAGQAGVLLAWLFGLTIVLVGATNLVVDACS